MKFYVKPDSYFYEAFWDNIPIQGSGETPMEAVKDLKRKLNDALCDKDMLAEIGQKIVETILTEMDEWGC